MFGPLFILVVLIVYCNDHFFLSNCRSIPHTMWVISHSNQQNVYFWRSGNKGCRAVRDNLEATIPDITFVFSFELTNRLYVNGNDSLDDYPLAVFCSAITNNDDERITRIIKVSRDESENTKSRRDQPEDPAHRERRLLREQLRRQREKEKKEKKEKRRIQERLRREQKKKEKEKERLIQMEIEEKEEEKVEKEEEKEEEKKEEERDEEKEEVKNDNQPIVENQKEDEENPHMDEVIQNKEEQKIEESKQEEEELPKIKQEPLSVPSQEVKMEEEQKPSIPTPILTGGYVTPKPVPSAPMSQSMDSDCVVMASALNHLHIWVLPRLELIKTGCESIIFDLTPFVPNIEIQDVAFLDGFDRKGTTVAVAAKNGIVLILDCSEQKLLYKVRMREIINE